MDGRLPAKFGPLLCLLEHSLPLSQLYFEVRKCFPAVCGFLQSSFHFESSFLAGTEFQKQVMCASNTLFLLAW